MGGIVRFLCVIAIGLANLPIGHSGKSKARNGGKTVKKINFSKLKNNSKTVSRPSIRPSMSLWAIRTEEHFPVGLFPGSNAIMKLGNVLGYSTNSTVYDLKVPGAEHMWAIKYYAFCGVDDVAISRDDSIQHETTVMQILNKLEPDVAPEHIFSSDANVLLPEVGRGKLTSTLPSCIFPESVLIRYMVMERVSSSLFGLLAYHGQIEFPVAAAMTLQVVRMLKKIHTHDIVHGDIHIGNIAIRKKGAKQLVLIDFGLARYGHMLDPSEYPTPDPLRPLWCHGFISIWESIGWQSSFRDDIFRTIQMMAILIHGINYYEQMSNICNELGNIEDKAHYYNLKSNRNFFDTVFNVPTSNGQNRQHDFRLNKVLGIENSLIKEKVNQLLSQLLAITRAPSAPMERPDYASIENILVKLISATHRSFRAYEDPAAIEFER